MVLKTIDLIFLKCVCVCVCVCVHACVCVCVRTWTCMCMCVSSLGIPVETDKTSCDYCCNQDDWLLDDVGM